MIISLISWPYFCFVIIGLTINLAISKAILIEKNVTIDFFVLFL